jgi:hypothetical protein
MSSNSLNYYNQGFRFNSPVEIRKQNATEEAEGPEAEDRTMKVLKLTEGFGLTEAGIKVSEDIDWSGHWAAAAAARRGIVRCLLDVMRF